MNLNSNLSQRCSFSTVNFSKSYTYYLLQRFIHQYHDRENKVLDIGCGKGDCSFFVKPTHLFYGIDIDSDRISMARSLSNYPSNFETFNILKSSGIPFSIKPQLIICMQCVGYNTNLDRKYIIDFVESMLSMVYKYDSILFFNVMGSDISSLIAETISKTQLQSRYVAKPILVEKISKFFSFLPRPVLKFLKYIYIYRILFSIFSLRSSNSSLGKEGYFYVFPPSH